MTFKLLSFDDLCREVEDHRALQATLKPSDPRHDKMCEVDEAGEWLTIYWGGYPYEIELSRIQSPEDVLWWVLHLGEKDWPYATASRVAHMVRSIARAKGWTPFHRVRPENEAPRPATHLLAERAKVTPALGWEVIKRDGWRCRACGFSVQDGAALHVDHIIPVSKGGLTEKKNLQTLCTVCNLGKGSSHA
tara:strand:- start:35076 stop:35648 length:573 start_codon:yes stop_codon:yes gene_type:complete